MNKYNELGIELINYKAELLNNYPDIVKRSLNASVDQLLGNNIIDTSTHFSIKDENVNVEEFKEYILTKSQCIKSAEELRIEYEALREDLDKALAELELSDIVFSESNVDKEKVSVFKRFCIDENIVLKYFKVSKEDIDKLMKRKGFIEKFAVLRLPKVLGDFFSFYNCSSGLFQCTASLVYYDVTKNNYCIDLIFDINVETLENPDNIKNIASNIQEIIKESINFYESKMF